MTPRSVRHAQNHPKPAERQLRPSRVVFIFGNPDLPQDSLPLRLLPKLKKLLPEIDFRVQDPHEEWETGKEIAVIDTVMGIRETTLFQDLNRFSPSPQITAHDFDALANLRYLQKLGGVKRVKIVGVPPDLSEEKALSQVLQILGKSS
uniref:Hydrogenase maturation protease n=1 Tax=candidate division WWE3 bacterium TaxID=2053526 RepID=A0A831YZC7_UNCKA